MPNIKSTLYLLKDVPLDPNYQYTLDFGVELSQRQYFNSKVDKTLNENDDYSYIRNDEKLKVYANVDDLLGVNYMYYENADKRYYAFITKKEYVSPTCTAITFKLDVMQTFMFDYFLDECFVEREHQDRFNSITKEPIYNRETEDINYGSYYNFVKDYNTSMPERYKSDISKLSFSEDIKNEALTLLDSLIWYVIYTKKPIDEANENDKNIGCIVNGIHSSFNTYLMPIIPHTVELNNNWTIHGNFGGDSYALGYTTQLPQRLVSDPNVLKIVPIKYLPFDTAVSVFSDNAGGYKLMFFPFGHNDDLVGINIFVYENNQGTLTSLLKVNKLESEPVTLVDAQETIDLTNYNISTPANAKYEPKLLTQPYTQLTIYNGNNSTNYDITRFYNDKKQIKILQSLDYGTKLLVYPYRYEQQTDNFFKAITKDMPELSLTTDQWLQFKAQNEATHEASKNMANTNQVLSILSSVAGIAGIVAGAFTGGTTAVAGAGALVGGIGGLLNSGNSIKQLTAKEHDIKNAPDEPRVVGNSVVLDNFTTKLGVTIKKYELMAEYKKKVFNYFKHYGYKCNEFKLPNIRSRYYYNYIKTIGCNIKTNIDAEYRQEIVNIYNNGITIWHYRDVNTFKGVNNYAYENVEMTMYNGGNN